MNKPIDKIRSLAAPIIICLWLLLVNILFFGSRLKQSTILNNLHTCGIFNK
jgi:hypothetical protein